VYRDGRFLPYQAESTALPVARTSADWYRGWRDHLGFATIDASMSPAKPSTKRQGAPPERDAP
jgi:hypothetical protein